MARRRGMQPMHDEHVNVTPLIDVIMCLIIFFMLVGNFARQEFNDKVVIPSAHFGQEMLDQEGRLVINVAQPDDTTGHDVITNSGPTTPTIEARGFKAAMDDSGMKELTKYLRKEKSETPALKIVVRADQAIPYKWIAPVLVACAQADIKSVNFSTKAVQK